MPEGIAPDQLPGVTPSRQQRSRETTLALLNAGAELLGTRSLAELSISDLCAQIGATVGAFYSRFDSKEAYFNALLALTLRDGREQLLKLPPVDHVASGLDAQCRLLVGGLVLWMRRHQGVLRAALVREAGPNDWTGFKQLAQALSERATIALLPAIHGGSTPRRRTGTAAERKTIAFGFQVVLGTLVNAILNDPGPLSINDDEIADRLSACLLLLLRTGRETAAGQPARKLRAVRAER